MEQSQESESPTQTPDTLSQESSSGDGGEGTTAEQSVSTDVATEYTLEGWLAYQLPEIPAQSTTAVIRLANDGATIPFIARYRKEATGNLDEVQIQDILEVKEEWDTILKRQASILKQIESQQKLTDELKDLILSTFDITELEDLYLPFKQKKKTKASLAKEAGIEPLANWVWIAVTGPNNLFPGKHWNCGP